LEVEVRALGPKTEKSVIGHQREQMTSMDSAASVAASLELDNGHCALAFSLDVQEIINSVGHDGAGATAVFIGTTRNTFKGKGILGAVGHWHTQVLQIKS
jgi:hypothetical protein